MGGGTSGHLRRDLAEKERVDDDEGKRRRG